MSKPYKTLLCLDFESRWSSKEDSPMGKYTLSAMTTEAYIRDPRFKAFGMCIHEVGSSTPVQWYSHAELPKILKMWDWSKTAVLAHNCVTGDHEVRTRNGWVRLDMLQDGVDVMQWDPLTSALSYTPAAVVRKAYTGEMIAWDTQYHKGVYTPNHRHYYQTPGSDTWRVARTHELAAMGQNNVYLPTTGVYTSEDPLDVTELGARVIEMVRADGNITPYGEVRFKFKKSRKIARCRALLDALGTPYTCTSIAGGVTSIRTRACIRMRALTGLLGVGRSKALGSWVLRLPLASRLALLDEASYWDGSVATAGGNGQTVVHSAKQQDVYWLSEMALLSGRSAQTKYFVPNTRGFSTRAKLVSSPTTTNYSGTVYCLTTPTEAFLVRRNGATWVTGNSQFDAAILSMVYGVEPCFIFDSLSMGRALRGVEVGNSLMKLAEDYGLPPKGKAVHSTDGLMEIPAHIEKELATYCMHDVFLCEEIFGALMQRLDPVTRQSAGPYPSKELRLIDMTVRMYTEPRLELDGPMLEQALLEENTKLEAALVKGGADAAELASNDQFAEVLKRMGVEPPTKVSKATGKEAYAFAKNDALFQALLNGDNEDVALLCEARLKVKSTLERTRAQRFIDIAERGALPVPLAYYGAATGRFAAAKGSNLNLQNLKRGSFLRKAIMAPDGYVLCVGDLSQIEPRVLAWLADYNVMLDIFRAGGDPYATFGSQMFNIPGLTKDTHPLLRQSAKSALLGAGYMLSWRSFAAQLLVGFLGAPPVLYNKAQARQLGVTAAHVQKFLGWDENVKAMADIPHTCSEEELLIHCLAAKAIIEKYRAAASPVVAFWEFLGNMLTECLIGGKEYSYKGVLKFRKGEIEMVNGMCLRYPDIQAHKDEKGRTQYTYADGKKRKRLHAGVLANNVTQGTARVVMTDAMLRTSKKYDVVLTVHDEYAILVPEDRAEEGVALLRADLNKTPVWMPGIPLTSDVSYAKRYGLAK